MPRVVGPYVVGPTDVGSLNLKGQRLPHNLQTGNYVVFSKNNLEVKEYKGSIPGPVRPCAFQGITIED